MTKTLPKQLSHPEADDHSFGEHRFEALVNVTIAAVALLWAATALGLW